MRSAPGGTARSVVMLNVCSSRIARLVTAFNRDTPFTAERIRCRCFKCRALIAAGRLPSGQRRHSHDGRTRRRPAGRRLTVGAAVGWRSRRCRSFVGGVRSGKQAGSDGGAIIMWQRGGLGTDELANVLIVYQPRAAAAHATAPQAASGRRIRVGGSGGMERERCDERRVDFTG